MRNIDEAAQVLLLIEHVQKEIDILFAEYPSLESLYEKEFGPCDDFLDEQELAARVFIDDYLFPETELFPIDISDDQVADLSTYSTNFTTWIKETLQRHQETQLLIRENFSLKLQHQNLSCHCVNCINDFRSKLRGAIEEDLSDTIQRGVEAIQARIDEEPGVLAKEVGKLQDKVIKGINTVKYRLKRASVKKLENALSGKLENAFAPNSDLGKAYIQKLMPLFKEYLFEENLSDDLITELEYDRFFSQLGLKIWRPLKQVKREFRVLVKSILALKRQDLSATILQEYLGQFWLHSRARQKKRKIVYHMGPTNSGKTHWAIEALCEAKKGCYLAPLRLLAAELFDKMNDKGVVTTLLTGEEVVEVDGATHFSSTIEMAKLQQDFDCCVIDEIQMITDPQRGWAWTRALVNINSDEIHICGDPSVLELIKQILKLTGDELEVKTYNRLTDLKVEHRPVRLGDLGPGDALIVFSRKNALKYKADLENLGFKVSVVYGRLSPEVRREQARKFDQGETEIIVATDAIAMGMNLPIRRVIFSTFSKFINSKEYVITHSEIKQIAGRAGRYNRYPTGFATTLIKEEERFNLLSEALECELDQKETAMVGPDLDIYAQVNEALHENRFPELTLVEFLRLFNTMMFEKPFYCVDLKEMIEVAEMVEGADGELQSLSTSEVFGFSCAPVNLGLQDHVEFFFHILSRYVQGLPVKAITINSDSNNIDYLETSIKCVELYQWLSRHFQDKNFEYDLNILLENKLSAVEKLNNLLSEKIVRRCSSCGCELEPKFKFNICEECFEQKRFTRRRHGGFRSKGDRNARGPRRGSKKDSRSNGKGRGPSQGKKKSSGKKNTASAFKKRR